MRLAVQRQRWRPSGAPSSPGFQLGLGPARGRPWGPRHLSARTQGSLPWSTRDGLTWALGLHSDAINRCRDQLGGTPSILCPPGMDLADWFGPQGVFPTGEAAHMFGSGSVPEHIRAHLWPVKDLSGSKSIMNGHLEVAAHGAPAVICTQVRTCAH
jgi:hypothetical protein